MVNSVDDYLESRGGERERVYLSFVQHERLEIVCNSEVIIVGLFWHLILAFKSLTYSVYSIYYHVHYLQRA